MTKVTIAIPNYKGRKLLEHNLPNIVACGADEVLINDDFSQDGSVEFLKENYPQVKVLESKENEGFIHSVNKLFNEASGEIVVLLNNDVQVDKNFLKPVIFCFVNPKVFAVSLHEKGEGYSVAFWQDGFFQYQRGIEAKKAHKSSWASGGSAAFRKSYWRILGGFDPIFYPGYWEDVDLSFRAIKKGYEVLWESEAKVIHEHGTTFSKTFKKTKINWIQQRNQLLFIWKNINDKNLINQHKKALAGRLMGKMGLGYWISFLWAILKWSRLKKDLENLQRSDLEAIDYVNS